MIRLKCVAVLALLLLLTKHVCNGLPPSEQVNAIAPDPFDADDSDGFDGYDDIDDQDEADGDCRMRVRNGSAAAFAHFVHTWDIRMMRFRLSFPPGTNVSYSTGAIRPHHWVWTYASLEGFMPYLKWPVDFPILSLSLLDAKSNKRYIYMDIVTEGNCSVRLGSAQTTRDLSYAFRSFTKNYLVPLQGKHAKYSYAWGYWCYLQEVYDIRDQLSYKFGQYFSFPVEFARYRCCKTWIPILPKDKVYVKCISQIPQMSQCTVIPYLIGLLMSAYFPIFLFWISANKHSPKVHGSTEYSNFSKHSFGDNWVFLDGTSPVSFQIATRSLCGLGNIFPVLTSRLRRALFIILAPCVVYIQLLVYWKHQHRTTLAFLEHKNPLGYLSLLAGIKDSRDTFVPMLGGPLCLLVVFYVAGFLFVLLPAHTDRILHDGTGNASTDRPASPLFYNIETIERLASISITRTHGYGRVSTFCISGIYMLANFEFWACSVSLQTDRMKMFFSHCRVCTSRWLAWPVCIILLPLYTFACFIELILCIVYFGCPIATVICIVIKGYTRIVMDAISDRNKTVTKRSKVVQNYIVTAFVSTFLSCLFVYYIFSFATLYISSFTFLAKILVFCLIALIVYPTNSFGYLFFGVMLIYYVFKLIQGYADGYYELLADAIEICTHMEHEQMFPQHDHQLSTSIRCSINDCANSYRADTTANARPRNQMDVPLQRPSTAPQDLVIEKDHILGLRKDLYSYIVKKDRPVHIQIFHACLQLFLIIALISISVSIILKDPFGSTEGAAEVMHMIFIMVIGTLPKLLELLIGNSNKVTEKETHLRKLKATILQFISDEEYGDISLEPELEGD